MNASVCLKIILTCIFLSIQSLGVAKDYVITTSQGEPLPETNVAAYTQTMDSIGSVMSDNAGKVSIAMQNASFMIVSHPSYSSLLVKLSEQKGDTIRLRQESELKELVVKGDNMTRHMTHESYVIPREDMTKYATFLACLNEIPNLTVFNSGALFYEGNSNVKLLLDGVETSTTELALLSKDDISKINVYSPAPGRFLVQGFASAIDVITKSGLHGGNFGLNLNQAFYNIEGNNSAALIYNYKRSKFSMMYRNINSHERRFRQNEDLQYDFDGVEYHKEKRGLDSPTDEDINSIDLSYQNNLKDSYLYNLKVSGTINRESRLLKQQVRSLQDPDWYGANNGLGTEYNKYSVSNYFEKNFGEASKHGKLLMNVTWQQLFSKYHSYYQEFSDLSRPDSPTVNVSSDYKMRLDGIFAEVLYQGPEKKWGQLSANLYESYMNNKYRDSAKPIFQRNNQFGAMAQYSFWFGKVYGGLDAGVQNVWVDASVAPQIYSQWTPRIYANIGYWGSKAFALSASYSLTAGTPSISQMSETDQWLDTKLVFHGNSNLHPYKTHSVAMQARGRSKYIDYTFRVSYEDSHGMICNYFKRTDKYMLETIVNLKKYNEITGTLSLTIKPLGTNTWTIWTRLIGGKTHGRGEDYKWDGYRFQWMTVTQVNLKKWSFEAYYQYPGKVAEGQLIRPRTQSWSVSAQFRPIENLSVGLEWKMPFGEGCRESERTVNTALVHNETEVLVRDWANRVSITLTWNVNFGKKQNNESPGFSNGTNDTGILKK